MKITKLNLIIAFVSILFLALFTFGAHQYFNDNKKDSEDLKEHAEKDIKENEKKYIKVDIVDEGGNLTEKSPEEEIEEEIIEDDMKKIEVNDDIGNESIEMTKTENVEEVLSVTPLVLSVPSKKRNNPDELRIGFITDLHVRSGFNNAGDRMLKSDFVNKINYFVEKMNNIFVPNFIIINGDIIEGTNVSSKQGIKELSFVKDIFERTTLKKYYVVGNHDLRSVTKKQFMQSLGINYLSKAFEIGNYKIIILDSNFSKNDKDIKPGEFYTRGHISEKQIKFLEEELKNTDKRTLVFLHHTPLWNVDIKSNSGLPDNAKRLQEIFSQNKVLAVFAGHVEDLFFQEINGVKYFVSPGIIKNKKYQGTFSEITIKKDKIIINMSYLKKDGSYRTVQIKED